jgi:acyl dehydratase
MARRYLKEPPRLPGLYARSALAIVPGASALPMIPGGRQRVPHYEFILADRALDTRHVQRYRDVCGFPASDFVPATYPHVLAFPLHMRLMSDGRFPFSPVGLVHVDNTITQHRPIGVEERVALWVRGTPLVPHRRGRTFSIMTRAHVGAELVWEAESTMLQRGGGITAAGAEPPAVATGAGEQWSLDGAVGRRYASVSGDRNPIHLHAVGARLFGFPRAIAHGMWAKARCLAALGYRLPDAFTTAVRFRRPILLPGRVAFCSEAYDDSTAFALRDADDPAVLHLEGSVSA